MTNIPEGYRDYRKYGRHNFTGSDEDFDVAFDAAIEKAKKALT